jgi:hypothetical protein
MNVEQQLEFFGYGYLFFLLLLPPVLILLPAWFLNWRSRFLRFCVATLVPWFGIQAYHNAFIQPLSVRLGRERGESLYDGTGASAGIFVVGFVVPVLVALVTPAAEFAIQRARSSSGYVQPDEPKVV